MDCQITLQYEDLIFHHICSSNSTVTIGNGKNDDIYVEGLKKTSISINIFNEEYCISSKMLGLRNREFFIDDIYYDEENHILILVEKYLGISSEKLNIPYNCILRIGCKKENDIVIDHKYISRKHCTLISERGDLHLKDDGSTNGVFVNGQQVQRAVIKSGDVIALFDVILRVKNSEITFENVGDGLKLNKLTKDTESVFVWPVYSRSPRLRESLPDKDIILAPPPSKAQKGARGFGMFSSLLGSGAMLATSLAVGASSPALMAARAASLVSPISSAVIGKKQYKTQDKKAERYELERRQRYGEYIEAQKSRIISVAEVQNRIRNKENPSPRECIDIAGKAKSSLWERRPSDNDFMEVRIGMGYEPICVNIRGFNNSSKFEMEEDDVKYLADQIIEETRIVDNVPARINFQKYNTVGIVGDREQAISLVRNILISVAALHSFSDVHIVGLFEKGEQRRWEFIKWLPHIWDDTNQIRFLAFEPEDRHRLCEILHETLKERAENCDKNSGRKASPIPFYLFIAGSEACLKNESLLDDLLINSSEMGCAAILMYDDIYSLPNKCEYIINLANRECPSAYPCSNTNETLMFTPDEKIEGEEFNRFARDMAAIELTEADAAKQIPNSVSFLEGYSSKDTRALNIAERWKRGVSKDTLKAPIGIQSNGKTFELFVDGSTHAHGLVAGMAGSGKSEVLLSWVLSLAVNYNPKDVNICVIDFKGGGMANQIMGLPHFSGAVSNIEGYTVCKKAIECLNSELERRQVLFKDAGNSKDLKDYRNKYKNGEASIWIPYLIVVADEFAEFKKEYSEDWAVFMKIARIGRSLGIRLILATQNPSGVIDDQTESNISYKMCLKVNSPANSREIIGSPDAAKLTNPGRVYINVGNGEIFELVQTYWSGAAYSPAAGKVSDNQIRIVNMLGQRTKYENKVQETKTGITEIEAVISEIQRVSKECGYKQAEQIFNPELPKSVCLHELRHNFGFSGNRWNDDQQWLKVPIGIFDDPKAQKQDTHYLDFSGTGHFGIYGAPSTGKTALLMTTAVSLCMNYSPQDVNLYIVDLGGWNLAKLKSFPHVGDVILDCEEEKFKKFCTFLSEELSRRKKLFFSHTVSSLKAYRDNVAHDVPAIIVIVDNIVPMFELFPDAESLFVTLGSQGQSNGIYLIYSSNSTTGVKYKLLGNIKGAAAFELTDKSEYSATIGKTGGNVPPSIPGRALFKGNPPLEFQTALCAEGDSDVERAAAVTRLAEEMNSRWDGFLPERIPIMPDSVTFSEIRSQYTSASHPVFGLSYESIKPAGFDLSQKYCVLVSGSVGTGKSSFLCKQVKAVSQIAENAEIYIFDDGRGSMASVSGKATSYVSVSDTDKTKTLLSELIEKLNVRKRAQNAARAELGDRFDELQFANTLPPILLFIDDLKYYVDTVEQEDLTKMEKIARLAGGLNVVLYAAGKVADMQKYAEIESLTRAIVMCQKGIALSDSAALFPFFKNDLSYAEKSAEFGKNSGMLFDEGVAKKIKLVE